jgi:ribosomal protein S18 acetylase RimI-like enzyme
VVESWSVGHATDRPLESRPSRSTFAVRPAQPDEYEAIGQLTVDVYQAGGFLRGDTGYDLHLRDVSGRAETCEILVADRDGHLLGAVTYVPGPGPWADLAAEGEAEFRMLVVAPEARGAGVGEALTQACVERARTASKNRVVLLSRHDMAAAHRLYQRLGFRREPARDWLIDADLDLRAFVLELR